MTHLDITKYIIATIVFFSAHLVYSENQIFNVRPLNSNYDDFAPILNLNENFLYFNRSYGSHSRLFKQYLNYNFDNIFSTDILDSIFSNKITEATDNITHYDLNPTYMSFKDMEGYFTGKISSAKGSIFGIYQATYDKNNWQMVRQIRELGIDRFNFHPSISPSGNILVYCTAKVDNPEDSDLMIAFKDEQNHWTGSIPLNTLNTNFSEITPFFASDDTLYFASNGLDGKGGFDVFYSVLENGSWQKPLPVEAINTEYDESDFVKINDKFFLFVSNRPGGQGGLDIWGYLQTNYDVVDGEPSVNVSLNTPILKIIQQSSYIQAINSSELEEANFITRFKKENQYYFLYDDSLISNPSHLEILFAANKLPENNFYQLDVVNNNQVVFSKKIQEKKEINLLPIDEIIKPNKIPEKLEIMVSYVQNGQSKQIVSQVEIIKSFKETPKYYEIDNIKYKVIIAPIPSQISNAELNDIFNFIKKEIKYKNSRIIVESSPTFELYDNEKIRSFLNSININNNVIIFQKRSNVNLYKYFYNLNFNYLLIYIQV